VTRAFIFECALICDCVVWCRADGDTAAVLAAADNLRDDVLPNLGVRMEDKGSGDAVESVWKLDDPATMRLEREQKEAVKRAKEEQKAEARRKQLEREEKAKVPPEEMFRSMTDQFSAFDLTTGMPTLDIKGEPISKKLQKKLEKDMEKQREVHQKYLASL
jgi:cysteinyl-tRNA synthetase